MSSLYYSQGLNGYVPPSRDGEEELDDDEEDLSLPLPSHSHALVSVSYHF